MAYAYRAPVGKFYLDGVAVPFRFEELADGIGSQPAQLNGILLGQDPRTFVLADVLGKPVEYHHDLSPIFKGFCVACPFTEESREVRVTCLDRRYLLNKVWIGRRHQGASGIRKLGMEIVFNRGGKPNKDKDTGIYLDPPSAPAFVYDKGNVDDPEDCETIEADYWTFGDILYWIWANYVDDIANPINVADVGTIPAFGGLDKKAGEVNVFTQFPGDAIEQVFGSTYASWWMDENGTAYIFATEDDTAIADATVAFVPAGEEYSMADHDMNEYPVAFTVNASIQGVVSEVDLLSAPEVREIMTANYTHVEDMDLSTPPGSPATGDKYRVKPTGTDDWAGHDNEIATWFTSVWGFEVPFVGMKVIEDDSGDGFQWDGAAWNNIGALEDDWEGPEENTTVEPVGALNAGVLLFVADTGLKPYEWENCRVEHPWRFTFKHNRYEGHDAGRNMRQKDDAKPLTGEMNLRRTKEGNFTLPDDECASFSISDLESVSTYYAQGLRADSDKVAIETFRDVGPNRWTHAVVTEKRNVVTAVGDGSAPLPENFYGVAVRNDFEHKTREEVKYAMPIHWSWIVNTAAVPMTSAYTITLRSDVPSDANIDFDPTQPSPGPRSKGDTISFSGNLTAAYGRPPDDPTITFPAGTVQDSTGPLTELSEMIEPQVGRIACAVDGAFALRRASLRPGYRLVESGVTGRLSGNVVVVGTHLAGNHLYSFSATNQLGASGAALASAFIDTRSRR